MNLSLFLEGGWVSRKDHLVTLLRCHYWLGGVGVQGKSDNVTLYHVFFFDGVPNYDVLIVNTQYPTLTPTHGLRLDIVLTANPPTHELSSHF